MGKEICVHLELLIESLEAFLNFLDLEITFFFINDQLIKCHC